MTDPATPTPLPPDNTPPAPPKKKRRWLRTVLILAVLLVVGGVMLVALLPTILSTSPVRSFAVGRAQAFIPNGRLDVADWSLGWFSPIRLQGVKLLDDKGNVVVEADEVKTDLTLAKAVRQKFELGDTVVDAAGHVVVYPDGSTNLQKLFESKTQPKKQEPKKTESEPATKPAGGDVTVPDASGTITLKLHGDATVLDAANAPAATARLLPGSGGTVRITDINRPIDVDLKFVYDTGENTRPGTVALKSSVDAIENNTLNVANASGSIDLSLADVDTAALKPVLAMAGQKDVRVAGIASGRVAGELKPGQAGGIKGAFAIAGLEVAAPQLQETYKATKVDLPIELSRDVVAGVSRLKLDTGLKLPELTARVTGDLPEPALQKLAAKQMPGDTGTLGVSLDVDMAKLMTALPKTLHQLPDVKVDKGALAAGVTVTLSPGDIQSHVKTDLSMTGTKAGQPVAVQPITFTADATATRLDNPVAGLRKLAASFSSAFASFQGGGDTVTTLKGNGRVDLAKAQQQVAQFVDLGQTRLAGTATFDLSSDAKNESASQLAAAFNATLEKLNVVLPGKPAIDLETAKLTAAADLGLDPQTLALKQITTAHADVVAGASADAPLVTAAVTMTGVDVAGQKIDSLNVTRLAVPNFARLQAFIDPFVPALRAQKIELTDGSLDATVSAKAIDVANKSLDLTRLDASIPALRVRRDGKDLYQEDIQFGLAATTAKAGDGLAVDVSRLSLTSALATLQKADGPLKIDLQSGLPRGTGAVRFALDAVKANGLARAFSPDAKVPAVTGGKFDGTLTLASAADKDATVSLVGALAGLTLADTPVNNETYTLDLNAVVPPAFDRLLAGVRVKGDYLSVIGKDIAVRMPAPGVPTQNLVENATFDVGVKDLAKANTVLSALVPGLNLPLKPAGALAINSAVKNGAATVDLNANGLVVSNAAGKSFAFNPDKPVTLKLAATIEGDKSIDGVRVTSLGGDFDIAQIKLAEPIEVKLGDAMTASGKINLKAGLDRLLPLLAVFQQADKPMPYAGNLDFTQTVAPKNGAIALVGTGTINDFAILDDAGKPAFKEQQVKITNDLAADVAKQVATINALSLDMASSNAAKVNVTGGVEAWSADRRLKNVVVDVNAVGEKVWPILFSMMAPAQQEQFKDAKLTGPIKIDLTANGAYPAKPTWNESVKTVVAYGGVTMKGLSAMGLEVSDFALPFSVVDNGKLITGDARKKGAARFAKPFTVNNGQGDFGSILIDIGNPNLPLSIGKKQRLLQKVQINPVMTKNLGSLASILFKDADSATGQLDVVAQECQNVPLMELMNKKATATFVYSLHEMSLTGPVPSTMAKLMEWGDAGVTGDIDDATLQLKGGVAYQDMTVAVTSGGAAGETKSSKKKKAADDSDAADLPKNLTFKGGVNLANNTFKDYKITLTPGLLRKDWRDTFPNGATVSLSGKVDDMSSIFGQAVGELGAQVVGKKLIDKNVDKGIGDILKKLQKK